MRAATLAIAGAFLLLGLFNAAGQLLLKAGADAIPWRMGLGRILVSALRNPAIIAGILTSWTCSVLYLALLGRMNLSTAAPIYVACATLSTVLLAVLIRREPISVTQLLGVASVLGGTILLLWERQG